MALFELAAAVVYLALSAAHIRRREWFGGTCYFLLCMFAAGVFLTSNGLEDMSTVTPFVTAQVRSVGETWLPRLA